MGCKIIFNVIVYIYLGKRSKGEFNFMCLVKYNLFYKIFFFCLCFLMLVGSYRCFWRVLRIFLVLCLFVKYIFFVEEFLCWFLGVDFWFYDWYGDLVFFFEYCCELEWFEFECVCWGWILC